MYSSKVLHKILYRGVSNINNREISDLIVGYMANYPRMKDTESDWREPIIGFSDAHDPMFPTLKELIGPNHALPSDIVPNAKSVIVFFLPFSKKIVKSNTLEEESSREWDIANIETNKLVEDLNKYLYKKIVEAGYHASLVPATYNYDEKTLVSDWSQRHVAYISGIGKFGIHNMLITDSGCCGRLGSIITDLKLKPSKRTKSENCLFKYNGSCQKCIKRCVNNVFQIKDDKVICDRRKCNEQIYDKICPIYPNGLGDACGKCMCNVPCSMINPFLTLQKEL